MLAEIADTLKKAEGVLITAHERPDGDAIGSAIALEKGLKSLGVRAITMLADKVPDFYQFLQGTEGVLLPSILGWQPKVIVALDCTEWERVGAFINQYLPETVSINIDHHSSNRYFADLNWVDIDAAATGEMVYRLLTQLQVEIDGDMASALYTAIATDTGFFQHANTSARVLQTCAYLSELGADPHLISEQINDCRSLESLKALGLALSSIRLSPGKQIAWMGLTLEDINELGVKEDDLDGLINFPKSIKGVEIGLLFRQVEKNKIRVGLRSRGFADVSAIAQSLGGGGHRRAAGCTVEGAWEEVIDKIITICRNKVGEF